MTTPPSTYFAFPFSQDQYILGVAVEQWLWLYNYCMQDPAALTTIKQPLLPVLALYDKSLDFLEGAVLLEEEFFKDCLLVAPTTAEIYFEEESQSFLAKEPELVRKATLLESLFYVDIIASQQLDLPALKLRLLETTAGFMPSFQYVVENTYQYFLSPQKQAAAKGAILTTQKRKKAFDQLFKEKILPFVQQQGFERHTKTSKRLFKQLGEGLSVVLFFEYSSFGEGAYAVSMVYFDKDIGTIEEDNYLARVQPNFPYSSNLMLESKTLALLEFEIDYWLRVLQLYWLPFITRNSTHQQLLQTIENKELLDQKKAALGISPRDRKAAYYLEWPSPSKKEAYLEWLRAKATSI